MFLSCCSSDWQGTNENRLLNRNRKPNGLRWRPHPAFKGNVLTKNTSPGVALREGGQRETGPTAATGEANSSTQPPAPSQSCQETPRSAAASERQKPLAPLVELSSSSSDESSDESEAAGKVRCARGSVEWQKRASSAEGKGEQEPRNVVKEAQQGRGEKTSAVTSGSGSVASQIISVRPSAERQNPVRSPSTQVCSIVLLQSLLPTGSTRLINLPLTPCVKCHVIITSCPNFYHLLTPMTKGCQRERELFLHHRKPNLPAQAFMFSAFQKQIYLQRHITDTKDELRLSNTWNGLRALPLQKTYGNQPHACYC